MDWESGISDSVEVFRIRNFFVQFARGQN